MGTSAAPTTVVLRSGPAVHEEQPRRAETGQAAGFGLLEVLIAAGLIIGLAAGTAQLTVTSMEAIEAAGDVSLGLLLAAQKMEQLRSLEWRYDAIGLSEVSDRDTDLSRDPPAPGGSGLRASPPDSLARGAEGYFDYLDRHGAWVGTGGRPPTGTAFVRRWSIQPGPPPFEDLLALDVVVLSLRLAESTGAAEPAANSPGLVWLATLKRRR